MYTINLYKKNRASEKQFTNYITRCCGAGAEPALVQAGGVAGRSRQPRGTSGVDEPRTILYERPGQTGRQHRPGAHSSQVREREKGKVSP